MAFLLQTKKGGDSVALLITTNTKYGNGHKTTFTKAYVNKTHYEMQKEQPSKTKEKERADRVKYNLRALIESENFTYFNTFTVPPNHPLAFDVPQFLKCVAYYLENCGATYVAIAEAFDKEERGFHAHALTDCQICFDEWIETYGGNTEKEILENGILSDYVWGEHWEAIKRYKYKGLKYNLYSEAIKTNQEICTNYVLKKVETTKSRIPFGTSIYVSNIKRLPKEKDKVATDTDTNETKTIWENQFSQFCKRRERFINAYKRINRNHTEIDVLNMEVRFLERYQNEIQDKRNRINEWNKLVRNLLKEENKAELEEFKLFHGKTPSRKALTNNERAFEYYLNKRQEEIQKEIKKENEKENKNVKKYKVSETTFVKPASMLGFSLHDVKKYNHNTLINFTTNNKNNNKNNEINLINNKNNIKNNNVHNTISNAKINLFTTKQGDLSLQSEDWNFDSSLKVEKISHTKQHACLMPYSYTNQSQNSTNYLLKYLGYVRNIPRN